MGRIPDVSIAPPGPKAREVIAKDREYMATSTKCSPIVAERASGSVVWDVDGNSYLDFSSGIAVLNVGHCHPQVVEAVRSQAGKLWHFAGTDYYYEAQAELSRRLASSLPGDRKVFLSNSGAESVEAAIKVCRWHSKRKRFLSFIGAFHGRTMGALSLTASKPVQQGRFFPTMPGVTHVPYAYCYRCPYKLEHPDCDCWCARVIEELYLDTLVPPDEVAGLFMEPMQGEGGYIIPPPEFPRILRDICDRHGIALVDDEVQAGMGRTGRMWAIEHFGVVPDVLCSAKALGSGLPIGATVFRADMDFGWQGAHSNTFGGNLLACASAMATLDVISDEGLLSQAVRKGEHVRRRLQEAQTTYPLIGDVRGLGMMNAIELVTDTDAKTYAVKERDRVIELSYRRGLVLLPCGKSGIRLIPPLNIPDEQLDQGIDIIIRAISEVE